MQQIAIHKIHDSFWDTEKGSQLEADTMYLVNQIALCSELVIIKDLIGEAHSVMEAPLYHESQGNGSLAGWYDGYSCAVKKMIKMLNEWHEHSELRDMSPITVGKNDRS